MCNLTINFVDKHAIGLLLLFWCTMNAPERVHSQQLDRYYDLLEELTQYDEEPHDWEDVLQELNERIESPYNLNTITKKELEQFPFLSQEQIENLLAYFYIKGDMLTIYELQLVESMDKTTIELLSPFVYVAPNKRGTDKMRWRDALKYGKNTFTARLGIPLYSSKGYERNYSGPPLYHALKYNYQYKDKLYMGLSAEQDKGEPFAALHNRKGYDWYGVYALLKDIGIIKALSLGNYRLNFGQGLVIGSNFLNGKALQIASSPFRQWGIYKHSSTDEFNYLRGSAITLKATERLLISAFYSHRNIDGKSLGDTLVTIDKSGLHRTDNEVMKRNSAVLQLYGGNVQWEGNRLHVGVTGIYYAFDKLYLPTLSGYAKYNMTGREFYNIGINYAHRRPKWAIDGEIAKSKKGIAAINRVQYSPSPLYRFLLIHRYYEHHYWSLFANSFSEGSSVQNENGWYIAADIYPIKQVRLFASIDFFSFPWLKYRISQPSQGVEFASSITYTPTLSLSMRLNYRIKSKSRDLTGTAITVTNYHHRLHYRADYNFNTRFSFRTFVDYNHFTIVGHDAYHGYQLSQRISCNFNRPALVLNAQISYFHTDNYDSRVYIAEKGLINSFYVPSFSGHGVRGSIVMRYNFPKNFTWIAKGGLTHYLDRQEIGSGNDLVASNRKSDIELQLRIKF